MYVGVWENGKKNGTGTFTFASGSEYVGEWKDHDIHGKGILKSKKTGDAYEGQFMKNKKEGYGTMTYPNGDSNEGEWADNSMNGHGTYTYSSSGHVLEGVWKGSSCVGKWSDT